jgi:non-specific serine/threonine protein kinase
MGQPERAAELFGGAEALREMTGAIIWPSNVSDYERSVAAARAQIGEAAFVAAWHAGRALRPQQAVEAALGGDGLPGKTEGAEESGLTPREREVAALVAQGMTNRQIGAALFITEGTARLHVKHILQKLGFNTRAQVAVWTVEQGMGITRPR